VLFALSEEGRILGKARVLGARLLDWEDIEAGPCGDGNCLFIADIGDNARKRQFVTIYSVPEPASGASVTSEATARRIHFPDGPQDAEAMFMLPDGGVFVVSKGRHGAISLYRAPAAKPWAGETTLVRVRELWPMPKDERDRVTAATATPDGRWIAIRTYRMLHLYPAGALVSGKPVTPLTMDLSSLRERQGEAVAVSDDGSVWLTSEAENKKDLPQMSRLSCTLESR
jgi:hypothetical protein